jgi:hypothetical protein
MQHGWYGQLRGGLDPSTPPTAPVSQRPQPKVPAHQTTSSWQDRAPSDGGSYPVENSQYQHQYNSRQMQLQPHDSMPPAGGLQWHSEHRRSTSCQQQLTHHLPTDLSRPQSFSVQHQHQRLYQSSQVVQEQHEEYHKPAHYEQEQQPTRPIPHPPTFPAGYNQFRPVNVHQHSAPEQAHGSLKRSSDPVLEGDRPQTKRLQFVNRHGH